MNEVEPSPERFSRRRFFKWVQNNALEIAATTVFGGSIIALLIDTINRSQIPAPNPTLRWEQLPENLQQFVPPVEIGAEVDSENFKSIVEELFAFANKVDAGEIAAIGKIPQTGRLAWERSVPFQKEGQDQNVLHLRWGFRMSTQLGTFVPDLTAREIAIGRFNFGLGIPFTSFADILKRPKDFIDNLKTSKVVNFTTWEPPRQFWPAPKDTQNESPVTVVKPLELSPSQLAAFLAETIDCFNGRIAIKKQVPKIDLGRLV